MEINNVGSVRKCDIRDAFIALQAHLAFEIIRKAYWIGVEQWAIDECVARGDDPAEWANEILDGMPGMIAAISVR